MATTDGAISILRALLVTGEALEASLAGALSTLGALLSQVLFTDVAASLAGAEVSIFTATWAFVLADVTQEAFVAVAYWLELVVHSALAMSRAQILVLVLGAEQVALATKETRHTLACCSAILTEGAVALAGADCQCAALAFAARALECTLVTKEARVACALAGFLWPSAATHELARLQEEGRVGVELGLTA